MSFSAVCESTALRFTKQQAHQYQCLDPQKDARAVPEDIIQQNSLAARVHGTSKGNTSFLTTRQRDALLSNLSRVAIFQQVQIRIELAHTQDVTVPLLVKGKTEETRNKRSTFISVDTFRRAREGTHMLSLIDWCWSQGC